MKIKNIELCNWGRYQKANVPVDISNGKNLVLIRAINNTGKTSLFYAIRFGLILLRLQDAIEESLDVIDEKYKSMSDILERPLFYDSPEIRKIVQDIRDTRSAILYIANTLSNIDVSEDEDTEVEISGE